MTMNMNFEFKQLSTRQYTFGLIMNENNFKHQKAAALLQS